MPEKPGGLQGGDGYVALAGSEPVQRSEREAVCDAAICSETIQVTVVARGQGDRDLASAVAEMAIRQPHQRRRLSHDEYAQRFGANREVLERIAAVANGLGLEVVETNPAGRSVVLRSTIGKFCEVFRVEPVVQTGPTGTFRSFHGPVHIPRQLAGEIEAVIGLDDIPVAMPRVCRHPAGRRVCIRPAEVADYYDFPDGDGRGQRLAILMLGGGFHEADLDMFFASQDLVKPQIVVHEIDGATNDPADGNAILAGLEAAGITVNQLVLEERTPSQEPHNSGKNIAWTIETTIDIELMGALANGAEIHVYFTPNNTQGKYRALRAALEDDCSIISLSWSGHESDKSQTYLRLMESVLREAAIKGVTVCCSSGDDGLLAYPSSSPYVLACGGTNLHDSDGRIVPETVWNEAMPVPVARRILSGGGVSEVFDLPSWQASARVVVKTGQKGRGVPDVAAKADLQAGYFTVVAQTVIGMGGTSVVPPLWASLIARINQHLEQHDTQVGYLTPLLYLYEWEQVFRDVIGGQSGIFQACPGWDPCTGLGSPKGKALLHALLPPAAAE